MAIAALGTATSSAATAAGAAAGANKQLSANFDTFLTMLTTQLKNQDPLSPLDTNQFTQQLVQFSQVEQQINSNKNLEQLVSLTKGQAGVSAVSYLGKNLTLTDGTGALINGSAKWTYRLGNNAAAANVIVTDAKGKTVYTAPADTRAGQHSFEWDGRTKSGTQLQDGAYTLNVVAKTGDGTAITTNVTSEGIVSEVDLTGTEPVLKIGSVGVPLSKATLVSQH